MSVTTSGFDGTLAPQIQSSTPKLVHRISTGTTALELFQKPTTRRIEIASGTGTDTSKIVSSAESQISVDRLYPHVFDPASDAGEALIYVDAAIKDIELALDAYSDADLVSVASRLSQASTAMKKAQTNKNLNDNFGAVTSYLRRATLAATPEDMTRPMLNSLLSGLRQLRANPMLGLDDASDLLERLSTDGWDGTHKAVEMLISALLEETDISNDQLQKLLFPAAI